MSLKKTSKNILGISIKVSVYALLITLLIILSTRGYNFGKDLFSEKGYEEGPGTDATITVNSGEGAMSVAGKLVDKGIIDDKLVFYVQTILYEASFEPGTYTVNSSLNSEEIIETLSEKPTEAETEGK